MNQPAADRQFGVSFSVKQCRSFQLDATETLGWLIKAAGFRRFRLMSYWNEHEKQPGKYNFTALDRQIEQIKQTGGEVSLCLGVRQPRWPENHWPDWAWPLPKVKRDEALLAFVRQTVERYKDEPCITSYQLENEALLKQFGERPDTDRRRLRAEYALVKSLDPQRPIVMTTSNSWGIPVRGPIPDIVGFSCYRMIYHHGAYHRSFFSPALQRGRQRLIKLVHCRPVFIHELQLEPWGPTAIWKMSLKQQAESMNSQQIAGNVQAARRIGTYPIDLWGGEWWYWRLTKHHDSSIWGSVKQAITAEG